MANEFKLDVLKRDILTKSNKPIIWIHMVRDINARNWLSFYSRNSTKLNQPYLFINTC